jgi:hypothetical protein
VPSPLLVSFSTGLEQLRSALIVERSDFSEYVREDHDRALGFRVLASAQLEHFVERRCAEVAKARASRFKTGQPTRTGRALLIWYGIRKKQRYAIPLNDAECAPVPDRVDKSLDAYLQSISATHGMGGQDFHDLVIPLGLRESDLDAQLFDQLDALAQDRQVAAHVTVKRAKSMSEPIKEWYDIMQVVTGLANIDEALQEALENF